MELAVDRNGNCIFAGDEVFLHRLNRVYLYTINAVEIKTIENAKYTMVYLNGRGQYFLNDSITKLNSPEGMMLFLAEAQ